jgi:hypothetical protein
MDISTTSGLALKAALAITRPINTAPSDAAPKHQGAALDTYLKAHSFPTLRMFSSLALHYSLGSVEK